MAEAKAQVAHKVRAQRRGLVGFVTPEPLPSDVAAVQPELEPRRGGKQPPKLHLVVWYQRQPIALGNSVGPRKWGSREVTLGPDAENFGRVAEGRPGETIVGV